MLIANLRKNCTACAPIFAVVDPTTEDTFFVNAQLLARKLSNRSTNEDRKSLVNRSGLILENVTFVLLDEPPQALESPPEPLEPILERLYVELCLSSLESSHTSTASLPELVLLPSDNLNPHVQVPLAGILLDYPIAYVPMPKPRSHDTPSYLNRHALYAFDICLRPLRTGDALELMKFSCPAEFLAPESSTTRNLNALREQLEVVIQNLNSNIDGGDGPQWEIVFSHSRITMDRVAL
ncbi:hypothetical protein RhiJN_04818 [Ceratobasidium sp. AG-Ba]|nr:hypothetical protein RhiJN_04818 [Ceratobasidium sp. AG-Ba]